MSSLPFFTLNDFDLNGKTVLLRVDINSPLDPSANVILDDSRFRAHLETINFLSRAKVVILAHQSRPGKSDFTSLKVHATHLSNMLRRRVRFVPGLFDESTLDEIDSANHGDILMLENTRFYSEDVVLNGEKMDVLMKTHLVKNLASHSDYFINDAFAAAHRRNTTIVGFSEIIPNLAGKLMEKEVVGINKFLSIKGKMRVGVFGGTKADDTIKIIQRMLNEEKLDKVLTAGLVGHFFLSAKGFDLGERNTDVMKNEVGNYEKTLKDAEGIISKWPDLIYTPIDFLGSENGKARHYKTADFRKDIPAMDIGIDTIASYSSVIKASNAVVLNGPMGVYELPEFEAGTVEIFSSIAKSSGYKIAGGGHTLAALEKIGINGNEIDHISTGGGALVSYLAGEFMPAIDSLINSKKKFGGG